MRNRTSMVSENAMKKICLVIIFNHRFDNNITILRYMYKNRFSHIHFIVPFYDGNDEDVIPVYENSYLFQGYIAQALERLKEERADYYFFISDDLILNPSINEKNLTEVLELDGQTLISEFCELGNTPWIMERLSNAMAVFADRKDVNYKDEIFSAEEAFRVAENRGFHNFYVKKRFKNSGIAYWVKNSSIKQIISCLITSKMPYPLVFGYSDWFILPKSDLEIIGKKMGVFAAMGLFVEIAIPTAVCLYSGKVKFLNETGFIGGQMWDDKEINEFNQKYEFDLYKLMSDFPEDKLYVHPVKLSKWSLGGKI